MVPNQAKRLIEPNSVNRNQRDRFWRYPEYFKSNLELHIKSKTFPYIFLFLTNFSKDPRKAGFLTKQSKRYIPLFEVCLTKL